MSKKKPWEDISATKKDVEMLWQKFNNIKETAEQYIFPMLLRIDIKYTPFYNDLMNDWNDHHARLFIYGLTNELKIFHLM